MATYTQALANLRATAEQLRAEHDKFCGWDGRLYNGRHCCHSRVQRRSCGFSASINRMGLLVAQGSCWASLRSESLLNEQKITVCAGSSTSSGRTSMGQLSIA